MSKEFRLQDPGEGIHEAEIVDLYIKPGDQVKEGDTLLDVETDKAVAEVPSPFTGTIDEVRVNKGDVATVGDVLFTYTGEGEAAEGEERTDKEESKEEKEETKEKEAKEETEEKEEKEEKKELKEEEEKGEEEDKKKQEFDLARDLEQAMDREQGEKEKREEKPARRSGAPVPAAPATRRLARELGVELAQVTPGGPHGRVTDEDVRSFAEQGKGKAKEKAPLEKGTEKPAPAEGGFEQWGAVESVPFRGVRRKIAEHLAAAWAGVPHVTHRSLVDITELEALRRRHKGEVEAAGGKLTATIFAIKAAVAALKRFPRFNASLDEAGENLLLKHYYHIGVAIDTDEGLLVPVIRDADRKNMFELAAELGALAERARAGKLELEEMRGGSFTITNPGMLGGTGFTPLINTPEVAILGLAQARLEPVVQGTLQEYTIVPRLMLPLCLAFDHRINDGADAARFVNAIAEALSDPEELMLKG